MGSSAKLRDGVTKVHVGHWLLLPMCYPCDTIKTLGSRRALHHRTGEHELTRWLRFISENEITPPSDVVRAVKQELNRLGITSD